MSEYHSPAEGTIRDARPGEPPDPDATRINLAVLNASHERFRIIKTYAQGGLGVVSIAHDIELDRVVAVKEMRGGRPSDDDIQRFLLEARLTGQLDHPGIPPVYALGYFEDGRPFYAMRLVDGVTLRSAIKEFHAKYPAPDLSRQRSMQLRQLIGAVVSVCNTLRFAHSKGVLHRDIKPSNIMLGEYGETLLMDWGLAKSQKQSLPYSELEAKAYQRRKRLEDPEDTGTGSVMGTPHYMSPEQALGDGESINQRSEVYSVGATLYSVLTGKPPFSGQTREEILEKVRRGDFMPPRAIDSRVPAELNSICLKAMALERGDRYADTGELATDIEHWLADESVSVYREPASRRMQRFFKAHQSLVVGLAVLMATCLVALMIGPYFVSLEHSAAIEAGRQAEAANAKAERIMYQSRDLLSRTFVTTFNSRIRNVPGTEKTRLEIVDLFIKQFESWSEADAESFQDRRELAQAIHERALIYNELNNIDLAWGDMQHSLHIFDELLLATDHDLHSSCLLDRMHLMADMAKLQNEFEWGSHGGESIAQRMYILATREAESNPRAIAYQYYVAESALQLGLAKASRNQNSEAFELISQAANIFSLLLLPEQQATVTEQLFNGLETSNALLLHCDYELARIAWRLGDREFAIATATKLDATLRETNAVSKLSFDAWGLKCANQLSLATFGVLENSDVATQARLKTIIQEMEKALLDRPGNRRLLLMQSHAFMLLAGLERLGGELLSAKASIDSAWQAIDTLIELGISDAKTRANLNQVHAQALDIARQLGDPCSELIHQEFELSCRNSHCNSCPINSSSTLDF